MKTKTARQEFKEIVLPALKEYGRMLQRAATLSIIKNAKRRGKHLVYNAAAGHLDLATGNFIQYGKPKWKKVKVG